MEGLATDLWWIEPNYSGIVSAVGPHMAIPDLIKIQRMIRRRIAIVPYGAVLRNALVRYTRALDMVNWEKFIC